MKISELVKVVNPTTLIIDNKPYNVKDTETINLLSKRYTIKKYTYDLNKYLNIEIKK